MSEATKAEYEELIRKSQISKSQISKCEVYEERNRLVAFLAAIFPSRRYAGEDPDWPVVMVQVPGAGQCTWHYPAEQAHLFAHVQELSPHDMFGETWVYDGHTTEEKYKRIRHGTLGVDDGT